VPTSAALLESQELASVQSTKDPVALEARRGLTATPKSLSPWLFYDKDGSDLFEQITTLPEYYLTRTERDLFTTHADDIFHELEGVILSDLEGVILSEARSAQSKDLRLSLVPQTIHLTIAELGAGTASKTGILLRALAARQPHVLYQPIDISPTALDEADAQIERTIPGVTVHPQVANYVTDSFHIERPLHSKILTLYIGSSIGNFSPAESRAILSRLRSQLEPGDALLLGTDLAPCPPDVDTPAKSTSTLLAAYNDKAGTNAAFNRNILVRLNRELNADFRPDQFAHRALWNHTHSRIEMHLQSLAPQTVHIPANDAGPALTLHFAAGETIHTENSYKFTPATIAALLGDSRFAPIRTFIDPRNLFAVTLAQAI
jgi:L-histidine Nalpha-methyltransferase